MTIYVLSADDATVDAERPELPAEVWIPHPEAEREEGHYEPLGVDNMADHGWHVLTEVAQPSEDHVRTVELVDGTWTEVWTFSQDVADQRVDSADRDDRRAVIAAKVIAVIETSANQIEARAEFYDSQPNATTNAQALAYVNTMKGDMEKLARRTADLQRTVANLIRVLGLDTR